MALTPVAERLALDLSTTCTNDLGLSRLGFEHPTFRLRSAIIDCAAAAANVTVTCKYVLYVFWQYHGNIRIVKICLKADVLKYIVGKMIVTPTKVDNS